MAKRMYLSNKRIAENSPSYSYLPICIIGLLFGYDSLSYLQVYVPAVALKITYFTVLVISYSGYLYLFLREGKLYFNYKAKSFIIACIFLVLYFYRIVTDLYFYDIAHLVYTNKVTYLVVFFNGLFLPLLFINLVSHKSILRIQELVLSFY